MPAYNVEGYISRAIESVLKQDYPFFELIIVDDGSTDNTRQVIQSYQKKDARIIGLHQPNAGVSLARNAGIKRMKGSYFTFIDADDTFDAHYLSTLVGEMESNKSDLVTASVRTVRNLTSKSDPVDKFSIPASKILDPSEALDELLYDRTIKNHVFAKLYRSSRLSQLMFDPHILIGEDMEYLARCMMNARRVSIIDGYSIYNYVVRADSAMNIVNNPRRSDSYYAAKKILSNSDLNQKNQPSAKAKVFSEAISASVADRQAGRKINQEFKKDITYHSRGVMCDNSARYRQRFYAFLAVALGANTPVFIAHTKKLLSQTVVSYHEKLYGRKDTSGDVFLRFYNAQNLGDDLFVKIVSERYGKYNFVILRGGLNSSSLSYQNIHTVPGYVLTNWHKLLGRLTGDRLRLMTRVAKKCKTFLYVGGSVFIEGNLAQWYIEQNFYKNLQMPYYILGANFGPYNSGEFLDISRHIIAGAKDVCFRDKASFELFRNIDSVRVATDIAFVLDTHKFDSESEGKIVLFSVIDARKKFDNHTANMYEGLLINLASNYAKDGYKVIFMSFCKFEGDEDTINRILDKITPSLRHTIDSYMYKGKIDEALALIASSEVVVASRFHASILGLLFKKKVLPIVYSDKTIHLLQDLRFKGPIVDIRTIDDYEGSMINADDLQYNNIDRQINLAEEQFRELDKVLDGRI